MDAQLPKLAVLNIDDAKAYFADLPKLADLLIDHSYIVLSYTELDAKVRYRSKYIIQCKEPYNGKIF